MANLVDLISKAHEEAKSLGIIWCQNQLLMMKNRIAQEPGVGTPTPAVAALKKDQNVGQYPESSYKDAGNLINPRKAKKKDVAEVANQLQQKAKDAMDDRLKAMSDQEIQDHFVSLKAIKAFIINRGGKLHSKAKMEDAIEVFKDLMGIVEDKETEDTPEADLED